MRAEYRRVDRLFFTSILAFYLIYTYVYINRATVILYGNTPSRSFVYSTPYVILHSYHIFLFHLNHIALFILCAWYISCSHSSCGCELGIKYLT